MKKLLLITTITAAIIMVSGCSSMSAKYGALGSKAIKVDKKYAKTTEIEGKKISNIVTVVPLGPLTEADLMKSAMEEIEAKNGINFLTDADVKISSWYIPLIYGQSEIIIKGQGWKEDNLVATTDNTTK